MSSTLPEWLTTNEHQKFSTASTSLWNRQDYLEKTLGDIQHIMAEDMYQAEIIAGKGLLQGIEPRIKVISVIMLLVAVASASDLVGLVFIHLLLIISAVLSNIRLIDYLKRAWIPALIFAGIAVLPGSISWITPGDTLVMIYQGMNWQIGSFFLPNELAITKQGLSSVCFVLLRATASLGLVVLLVKTTRWTFLTKAVGSIGLPMLFVMVLELTYRYLFLFLLLLSEYIMGRKSRLVAAENAEGRLAWIGSALAGFFRLIWQYSREVNAAMIARGFTGENHLILTSRPAVLDICFLGIVFIVCISVWGGAHFVQYVSF